MHVEGMSESKKPNDTKHFFKKMKVRKKIRQKFRGKLMGKLKFSFFFKHKSVKFNF